MTLCVAWIRRADGEEPELVMATDSRLTGGESWDSGVKLFELPRQDCLLCFAGATARAYPLILNTISSIKFDNHLANSHTDIHEVLEFLVELFSDLVSRITDVAGNVDEIRAEAEFLFGGWSWKTQQFEIWKLYYEPALEAFTHSSLNQDDARVFTFMGDHTEEAQQHLIDRLTDNGKLLAGTLDMEPLQVLAQMSRADAYHSIGGALQIAKIYQSGTSEFFGVMWQSVNGRPTFLGRDLPNDDLIPIRLFDPDNALILDDPLPETILDIDQEFFGLDYDYVSDCYPDGHLNPNLIEKKRKRLKHIIQTASYRHYLSQQNPNQEVADD